MKHSKTSRLMSVVMAVLMVVTMFPVTAFAAENGTTYTEITSEAELVTGEYIVVASNGVALTAVDGTWITGTAVEAAEGKIVANDKATVWTLTVGENGVVLTDPNGVSIAPKGGNNNGLSTKTYEWSATFSGGKFVFGGQGEDTVYLAYNSDSQYLKFRGYKTSTVNGNPGTYPYEFTLYKAEAGEDPAPEVPEEPSVPSYGLVSTVKEGDTVVMYNANSGTLVSSAASGYKLAGVNAAPENGVITTEDTTVAWTVGKDGEGNWTFTQGDKVLGMVQSGSYVNLSTSADSSYTGWTLESSSTDKVFYLRNTNMPASSYGSYYLEYYSGWTAYASSSPSDAAYGISFYALGASGDDTVEPEVPDEPKDAPVKDGDKVVIYNPANMKALSSNYSGYYNAGVDVAVDGDKLSGYTDAEIWTVSVSAEGTYTFSTADGQKLSMGASYTSMPLDDINSEWSISEAATENCYYILNTARGAYIEYQSSYGTWSGYYNITDEALFAQMFYVISDEAEASGKITSADQFVSGVYAMVVETGTGMGVLEGNWVTAVTPTIEGDKVTDAQGGVWTLSVTGNTVVITDSNGVSIAPAGGNTNGISSGTYEWNWSFNEENGTFVFTGTGNDTVTLASNTGSSGKFRAYKNTTVSGYASSYPHEFTLYALSEASDETTLPSEGDKVVIYNLSAMGVLGAENDVQSINNVSALVWTDDETGKDVASVEDGAVIFTVSKNGNYYRFYNETYGWLCSNGTGNNAFYTQEASEDADWLLLEGKSGGWNLESRTAKYNGTYSQYLEYYADSYKTYSMYNVTDYDIYEFFFYPVDDTFVSIVGDIVHNPDAEYEADNAYIGQDWKAVITVKARLGVKYDELYLNDGYGDVRIPLTEEHYTVSRSAGESVYEITVPAEMVKAIYDGQAGTLEEGWNAEIGIDLYCEFEGVDHSLNYGFGKEIIDEPSVGSVTPAANAQTGEDKRPVISAEIFNAGADAAVTMTVNGEPVDAVYDGEKVTHTPSEDMAEGRTTVTVTVVRADGKETEKTWSFIVGEAQYELYFGQLHSHTTYSDGSGSLESALEYIANLPESANVDFVAFTDHSNYFDGSSAGTTANPEGALYDMSLASEVSQSLWSEYKGAIAEFNASQSSVVAIGGFEMTWSGGPGHINTFNTEGIVSRNNTTLNNKTNDAGMKAYYALLSQTEGVDSISQFNHPGSTFGTFTDFAYWDAVIDSRIYLVEVGNGEGQIGAGGYYPSYEYYTMALDKGWHVAPTNNQDNHKGKWGNANDARDVILTDDFSEEGIYEAIRALRMYSTEDKNLEIGYTVNGLMLGSSITEVPEKLNIEVTVYDPDNSDSISKVEVIVNSGKVAYTWDDPADLADGALSVELDPTYSYYYIRVTEGDGDLAVTAPVWVGDSLKLGISSVATTTSTPVTGEELTITTTLFNSENTEATVKSLVYTVNGSQTIGLDVTGYTLPASGTLAVDFAYTPDVAKVMTVTVTAVVVLEGEEYTFTMDLELDVQDADKLVYLGIDASHYNEYVNGNYKDNMGNFTELAAEYGVRTVTIYESEDLIAACSNPKYKAIILTAPSRRSSEAQSSDPLKVYTDEEIAAIKEFNANGGIVILAGWSDHYENYPAVDSIANMKAEEHMAATQNAVLEALGSSLRIGDDATYDDEYNGGQAYRLYFNTYGENFLTEGVEVDPENPHDRLYTEVFSHYGGASVYTVDGTLPSTVSPVVFGHSGTYSVDVDNDGLGGNSMPKYAVSEGDERLMIMASEQLDGQGLIIVSGAAFMSNFEVQATIEDSGSEKNYSNYKICENLLAYINPAEITPISEVNAQTETGIKYTIEGVVTSNASGYDKDTAFFDCIYVQDETGGICCFPVAGNYKVGDMVRVTGTTDFYQGEPELQVTSIEVIGEGKAEAKEVTPAEINDRSVEGQLITITGIITSYEYENGLIQTIYVKDYDTDDVARVFIDGYITTSYDVENIAIGAHVTVTGIASYDDTFNAPEGPFPRIRIRDRKDVVVGDYAYVTVIYDPNGGEVEHPMKGYPFGSGISGAPVPTREGYTFDGWYDEDGVKLDSSYRLYRNTTFTARWTEGTGGSDDGSGSGSSGATHEHDWSEWKTYAAGYAEHTCSKCGLTERVYTGRTEDEGNPETGAPAASGSAVSAFAAVAVLSAAAYVLGKRK